MAWKELGILLGVLVVWFSLMRFVLPAMGVATCMSGACRVGSASGCAHPGSSLAAEEAAEEPATTPGEEPDRPDSGATAEGP